MKLSFFGAAGTVTGSRYLIEHAQKSYLVDCGLFQGFKQLRLRNREPFPIPPAQIESVLLTHAHIDHSGYLPLLVRDGFKGPIYTSKATRDLCEILLADSGKLQEEDARRANRYGYSKHRPALPLYTVHDAEMCMHQFHTVNFDSPHALGKDFHFTLKRAGHILGSAMIQLENDKTTLLFTGDLGRPNDPLMRHPEKVEFADYLVVESTYGNRLHSRESAEKELEEVINSTLAKGGTVVVPAFAVGRAQTILYYIHRLKTQNRIPANLPVYLDSPMAQDATSLMHHYCDEHTLAKHECSEVCQTGKYVQTTEDSKRINASPNPSIIISASGMAEGGRVLHHIAHYAPDSKNTILFAGFQAGGTRGDRMVRGEKEVKIHGEMVPIRARVENMDGLSSHVDYEELLEWLKGFKQPPKTTFLTHGEPEGAQALKEKIESQLGWKVIIPEYLESFDLDGNP